MIQQKTFLQSVFLLLLGTFLSYYVSLLLLEKANNDSLEVPSDFQICNYIDKNLTKYEKCATQDVIKSSQISISLKDLVCDTDLKQKITFLLQSLKNKIPSNIPLLEIPNGVLLYGPPGTGKTMLAKAIAKECNIPFINISYNIIENKYYGESPKILKAYFTLADKIKPCIIFFDEIDGFLSTRNSLDQSSVNGLKTLFLTLMDGLIGKDSSILIIGATNRVDQIDPAVRRRLSNHICMDKPSEIQIKAYVNILLPSESFDDSLYSSLVGFSYSSIKELFKCCSTKRFLSNNHLNKWSLEDITSQIDNFKTV